jgi:hypothetical protein
VLRRDDRAELNDPAGEDQQDRQHHGQLKQRLTAARPRCGS